MHGFIKRFLFSSINLENQRKLVDFFARNLIDRVDSVEYLRELLNALQKLCIQSENKLREIELVQAELPEILNFDKTLALEILIRRNDAPWRPLDVREYSIPGMIAHEEKQYYRYVGQFYSGRGAIIELGPWLGLSTHYIVDGLLDNPKYNSNKVQVYDDFVWRSSWMDNYVNMDEKPGNYQDFQWLFEQYSSDIDEYINVNKFKITDYDGNQDLSQLTWDGGEIELMYIDCGRTFEANQAWYKIFSEHFIPGVTILIMQDWGLHKELPPLWYNQIKQFTESKGQQIQMIHELCDGNIATFIFKGAAGYRKHNPRIL